jgi:outer membrane receptor protein involved in Fe transport
MRLPSRFALALLSALSLGIINSASAQTAPVDQKPRKVPVETTPASLDDDETVVLSPFTVSPSEGQDSYLADSTLAGARVRTSLNDIGSALTVVTKKFMEDIGATNNQSLLTFTTNTEVGGTRGNFGGMGNAASLSETGLLVNPNATTRIRGLDGADATRDYFLSSIPWDSFNIDRVELQRGANSILFGVGSPAGIINTSTAIASYKDSGKYEFRFGKYGSIRNVIDVNRTLLKGELAFRVIALDDHKKFQQEPAFNHDRRIYAAMKYEPKFLQLGSAHTTLSANYEHGEVRSNNPRSLPPIDGITPWFYPEVNKLTLNPGLAGVANSVINSPSLNLNPWLYNSTRGNQYKQDAVFTYNYDGGQPITARQEIVVSNANGIGANGAIDGSIGSLPFFRGVGIASYGLYATSTEKPLTGGAPGALQLAGHWANILPGGKNGLYKDRFITDPTIFDFYNNLIDGPNKHEWQNWDAFNVNLVQTFFKNRLALQAVYDRQDYSKALANGGLYKINIDINTVNADGTPNANLGRPYIAGDGGSGGDFDNRSIRTATHITATGDIRGEDFFGKSKLARIIGKHIFTGLWSQDRNETKSRQWLSFANSAAFGQDMARVGSPTQSILGNERFIDWVAYIGPSLLSATSAAGANLNPLKVQIEPQTTGIRWFDTHWAKSTTPGDPNYVNPAASYVYTPLGNPGETPAPITTTQSENPANYVGWRTQTYTILNAHNNDDIKQLYRSGTKQISDIKSKSATWQAFWLDNLLVSTLGYRTDKVTFASNPAPRDPVSQVAFVDDYTAGPVLYTQEGISRSLSLVLHTPERIRRMLPQGTEVSFFYNKSANTGSSPSRIDILGNPLPNPSGRTQDYGIIVSAFDKRLALKVNWYKTTVEDATLSSPLGGAYYTLAGVYGYGAAAAVAAKLGLAGLAPSNAATWDWSAFDNNTPLGAPRPLTGAGAATDEAELVAADSMLSQLPSQAFMSGYFNNTFNVAAIKAGDYANGFSGYNPAVQLPNQITYAYNGSFRGVTPVATTDTESKGIEFELSGQPLKDWNISVNVSHTEASRQNIGATFTDFILKTKAVMDSPAGLVRQFSNSSAGVLRDTFNVNVWYPYLFLRSSEGSTAPEISPWRANAVTSYTFSKGSLKGFNVGAGYRWQQGRILGYGITQDAAGWNQDVNKPIHGSSQDATDLWVGYSRKLTKKIGYRVQLNMSNVGDKAHLVPISVQPDGSPAAFRIQDGMGWQVTNTFTF